jgi:hypothetical protein
MLVDPDECAVDEDIFEIGIAAERLENALPNALLRPPPEASIRRKPLAERFRQIAPWRARPRNPKNRFDKKPVVTPGAAGVTNFYPATPAQSAPTAHRSTSIESRLISIFQP